jgi:hypothetical protein
MVGAASRAALGIVRLSSPALPDYWHIIPGQRKVHQRQTDRAIFTTVYRHAVQIHVHLHTVQVSPPGFRALAEQLLQTCDYCVESLFPVTYNSQLGNVSQTITYI